MCETCPNCSSRAVVEWLDHLMCQNCNLEFSPRCPSCGERTMFKVISVWVCTSCNCESDAPELITNCGVRKSPTKRRTKTIKSKPITICTSKPKIETKKSVAGSIFDFVGKAVGFVIEAAIDGITDSGPIRHNTERNKDHVPTREQESRPATITKKQRQR